MTFALPHGRAALCGFGLLAVAACAPSSLVEVNPPNAVADPAVITTASGATQLYNYAITRWGSVFGGNYVLGANYIVISGLFSDELLSVQTASGLVQGCEKRGASAILCRDDVLQSSIHAVRTSATQAREALRNYAPNTPVAWQARLLAAEGYAHVYLAEMMCSGVPLSTVPLVTGTPMPSRGYSTQEILERAIALFDSAITLAGDSARFKYLAAVGKGRSLLQLGRFADAATAVTDVPTDFVFLLDIPTNASAVNAIGTRPQNYQVVDAKGTNGLVWSTDPRTGVVQTPTISGAMLVPGKYSVSGGAINASVAANATLTRAADGLEARLIEAEADLAAGGSHWLSILNSLRATCIGTAPCAPVPGLTAASLLPLTDPGNADARLTLLMRERAMWLFLTGHRQGDLRRLARQYHRDPPALWPTGTYVNPGFPPLVQPTSDNGTASYESLYVRIVLEQGPNPLFTGCIDLNP